MQRSREIERLRPAKNSVDATVPYHFLQETEPNEKGRLQRVNTIFLTGKECAFKCLMCDLWKNTLDGPTPAGAIIKQLDHALSRLPAGDVIKLYNASNFFDPNAVPPEDYPGIIERIKAYKRVIVENHPKLCGDACLQFSKQLKGKLEVAMGLETIHPDVLPLLSKQMTKQDFADAAAFLTANDIDVRAFILLNPPYLTGKDENIKWTVAAVDFAFESGAKCCSIIPTRPGNGIMEVLQKEHHYVTPSLDMLEEVFEWSLTLKKGRVFVDTWDIGFLSQCAACFDARKNRLDAMNLDQQIHPKINCHCHPVYA
jgi:radical SAM enzyme (TIGR01210 family)